MTELTAEDLPDVARIADNAFSRHPFYQTVLGFDAVDFACYWKLFLPLAIEDPSAHLFGLKAGGRCVAMAITADEHFPSPRRALFFLFRLLLRVGPGKLFRYLRFVAAYERVMRRAPSAGGNPVRALWLSVARSGQGIGLGRYLARAAQSALAVRGETLFLGLIDGSDERLIRFYRRLGFQVGEPFLLFGRPAARIEMRRRGGSQPCLP